MAENAVNLLGELKTGDSLDLLKSAFDQDHLAGLAVTIMNRMGAEEVNEFWGSIRKDRAFGKSSKLAEQSKALQGTNLRGSLLLAKEAFEIAKQAGTHSPAADSALRDVLQILLSRTPSTEGKSLPNHVGLINTVAVSYTNNWLVTGSEDGQVCLWNLDNSSLITLLLNHECAILSMAISSDNNYKKHWLVVGCKDGTVHLWDLKNYSSNKHMDLKIHKAPIRAIAISRDNKHLVTTSDDGKIYKWNLNDDSYPDSSPLNIWEDHKEAISALSISDDSEFLFTSSYDCTVRRWNLKESEPSLCINYNSPVQKMIISWDNHWLVTGHKNGEIFLFDLSSSNSQESKKCILPGHNGQALALNISHNNRWLAVSSDDNTVRLWDLLNWNKIQANKDPIYTWKYYNDTVQTLIISPDNHWLIVGRQDGVDKVIDLYDLNDIST